MKWYVSTLINGKGLCAKCFGMDKCENIINYIKHVEKLLNAEMIILSACKNEKEAIEVCKEWNDTYKRDGKYMKGGE